ncbi:MAG: DUF5946 family protein [Blastococcus sp.]
MPAEPIPSGELSTETCPGCGAVLAPVAGRARPGASPSCSRLFEVTLRGLREESLDPAVAAVVRLADDAYEAQHSADGGRRPEHWRTTVADVAADLDVIDLRVLVESWARSVHEDVAAIPTHR